MAGTLHSSAAQLHLSALLQSPAAHPQSAMRLMLAEMMLDLRRCAHPTQDSLEGPTPDSLKPPRRDRRASCRQEDARANPQPDPDMAVAATLTLTLALTLAVGLTRALS